MHWQLPGFNESCAKFRFCLPLFCQDRWKLGAAEMSVCWIQERKWLFCYSSGCGNIKRTPMLTGGIIIPTFVVSNLTATPLIVIYVSLARVPCKVFHFSFVPENTWLLKCVYLVAHIILLYPVFSQPHLKMVTKPMFQNYSG